MAKILVVDDEINLLELIKYTLEKEGHRVITAMDGEEGYRLLEREAPDLIILDVMMPKLDGLEFCRLLRSNPNTNRLPVIMVSAKGETIDHIIGLEIGADDYISKPFSPRELAARVKAKLRHLSYTQKSSPQVLKVGNIVLDLDKIKTIVDGRPIDLTPKEFKLLKILMSNPGKVFTREVLLDQIWEISNVVDSRTVDVHIRYVRQKIEKNPANPDYILTVRGVGYKFREI